MNAPNHFIRILIVIVMLGCIKGYGQALTDSIPPDSIHPFHRKKGDVLNYLLVDNFNNPALAGSLKSYQAQASYGNNLPGSKNQVHYGQVMLDMYFGNKQGRHGLAYRMGIGHIGFSNSIRQRIDYSFQCINRKNVSLRIGAGIGFTMQQFIDPGQSWGDMIDDRYGYVYSSQEKGNLFDGLTFKVRRFQWNAGAQLRIYNGYINIYNTNDLFINPPASGPAYYPGLGINALYNVQLKPMQIIPSVQFNYWNSYTYNIQGGVFLASNTSKGGGGGIYYNNYNVFTISGMFAWNDYLRIYAQVQLPFSEIRYTYPVSNFQITVSYKINDFGKYE
jgi:hypothetical protein